LELTFSFETPDHAVTRTDARNDEAPAMASPLYHPERMNADTLLFKVDSVRRIDAVIDFFGEPPPSADVPRAGATGTADDERAYSGT
jgi:hypothetical protein